MTTLLIPPGLLIHVFFYLTFFVSTERRARYKLFLGLCFSFINIVCTMDYFLSSTTEVTPATVLGSGTSLKSSCLTARIEYESSE